MAANGVSEVGGTVDSSDRHVSLPSKYTRYEHILVLRNPASKAGSFEELRGL
jgi:hypothetical protein